MTFQLDGNHLVYGEMFRGDDCDIIEITKVDLEAKSRGVREPAEVKREFHMAQIIHWKDVQFLYS